MLFVTNSVKASVFVHDALSRANLQATIYRTKKAKVKNQQISAGFFVCHFLIKSAKKS